MNRRIRLVASVILLPVLMMLLSGCWTTMSWLRFFIVTGVALDQADDPEQLDITLQIGKTNSNTSGTGEIPFAARLYHSAQNYRLYNDGRTDGI